MKTEKNYITKDLYSPMPRVLTNRSLTLKGRYEVAQT